MKTLLVSCVLTPLAAFNSEIAHAAEMARYGVFFYSSECYVPVVGDAGGNYVKLTRTHAGDKIEYGWSAEGPMEKVNATKVRISGTAITFTVPSVGIYESSSRQISGTILAAEMRLSGAGVNPPVLPRRADSFEPGPCPPVR